MLKTDRQAAFLYLPEVLRRHSRDSLLIALLVPHQSFGSQVSFSSLPHLLRRARDVLIDQIHLIPVVLVPAWGFKAERSWWLSVASTSRLCCLTDEEEDVRGAVQILLVKLT